MCPRSKPIVEELLRSMPELPQSEPPRCPGQTSTSSGRLKQALVQRAEDLRRPLLRARSPGPAGRRRRRTASRRSAPPRDRRRGRRRAAGRRCARAGGRASWIASIVTSPSSSVQPSSNASCGYSAAASSWTWIEAPVARASRPWPETWSAWLWVSSTCSIRTPCRRRGAGRGRCPTAGRPPRRPPRRSRRPDRRRSRGPRERSGGTAPPQVIRARGPSGSPTTQETCFKLSP